MFDRMQLLLGRVLTVSREDLKREEGQGTTEYAMVIGFVVVTLTISLGLLGGAIEAFLGRVAGALDDLIPAP
jgi:Flp pilus assembly pilin Flp